MAPSFGDPPIHRAASAIVLATNAPARVAMINRCGAMWSTVFTEARQLGVKTCVGTESPLDIPDGVQAKLKERGLNPDDPATLRLLYQGIAPNISALAQAGWEQGEWSRASAKPGAKREVEVFGGQTAAYLNNKITGTDLGPIYQTVRFNLRGYRFAMPDGPCADFGPEVEYPCIAAIDLAGGGITRRINCGGPAYQDFAADPNPERQPRDLPVADYYEDWASAQFGPVAGPAAAAIFTKLDGNFPQTSAWITGPGAIAINQQRWATLAPRFAFVDEFAALRPRVQGPGNLERLDWWLNTFRVTREMGRLGCLRGELNAIISDMEKKTEAATQRQVARERALPVRLEMVRALGALHEALLATLHNATELGTLCNIEQQSMLRLKILTGQDAKLEKFLAEPLPAAAQPWKDYRGDPRLVVLTARTTAWKGEALTLKIIALDKEAVKSVSVHVRPLGQGDWQTIPASHLARAVCEAKLPATQEDFEYYITADKHLVWPGTAPQFNQTVVVFQP